MKLDKFRNSIDKIIEISIYVMVFCLPFSKAMVEISISMAILCWFIKKVFLSHGENTGQTFFKRIGSLRLKNTQFNKPLFAYVLICLFSVFISTSFKISFRSFSFKTLEYFLLYFIIIETMVDERKIKNLFWVGFSAALVIGVDAIFQHFAKFDFIRYNTLYQSRVTASFKNPNDLSAYIISFIPLSVVLFFSKTNNKFIKTLVTVNILLLIPALILTHTRGAWIGFLAGLVFVSFFKRRVLLVLILFMVALVIFSPNIIKSRVSEIFTLNDTSSLDRRIMWSTSFKMLKSKPLFGHGLGTFMKNFSESMPEDYIYVVYAHNCYLQMAVELGLTGLFIFLWFVFRLFRRSTIYIMKLKSSIRKDMIVGILGGLLAFLIHSFFDTNLYSLPLMTLFWFMIAIVISLQNIEESAPSVQKT